MFLTRGEMPHEQSWAAWLAAAEGQVPVRRVREKLCEGEEEVIARCQRHRLQRKSRAMLQNDGSAALDGQHLFSVYVHPPPDFEGYPPGTVFHNRQIAERIQVLGALHLPWHLF